MNNLGIVIAPSQMQDEFHGKIIAKSRVQFTRAARWFLDQFCSSNLFYPSHPGILYYMTYNVLKRAVQNAP